MSDDRRKALLARVHLAKKDLGLTDEEYRAVLEEQFGTASARDLGVPQLADLLNHFIRRGWRPSPPANRPARREEGPIPPLGANKNRRKHILLLARRLGWNMPTLNRHIRTRFGVDHLDFLLDHRQLVRLERELVELCREKGGTPLKP